MNKSLKFLLVSLVIALGLPIQAHTPSISATTYSLGWIATPEFNFLPVHMDQEGAYESGASAIAFERERWYTYDSHDSQSLLKRILNVQSSRSWSSIQVVLKQMWNTTGAVEDQWDLAVNMEGTRYENADHFWTDHSALPLVIHGQVFFGDYYPGDRPQTRTGYNRWYFFYGFGMYLPFEFTRTLGRNLTLNGSAYPSLMPLMISLHPGTRYGAMLDLDLSLQWKRLAISMRSFTRYTLEYTGGEDEWSMHSYPVTVTVGFLFD
ncbi:MAG: hypothetical protein K9N46_09605 [Candidatus Marinimicrobia bacterium]|nr:hypothetical protein [Candidatus Neomarinimicrobiota bacterium]MCF7828426.1 hypothetical protein [Candidatus Neomarinimicrobiota bacterium]MCF7880980.1 hypothetical protein [Candidatus Neomarinimicrobiota bacterium]